MAKRRQFLRLAVAATIILMVGVFVARTWTIYNYSVPVILQSGLFYDKVCYKGSYEIILCSDRAPPYETYWAVLSVFLIIFTLAFLKKK